VLTASPARLVVMLYDGARRFLAQAGAAMRDGQVAEAHRRLGRAEAIIEELLSALDFEAGGEIAERLEAIYVFCRRQIMEARIGQDPEKLEQVSRLLGELRAAWSEIAAVATV
jgi:flagellar protein FliS